MSADAPGPVLGPVPGEAVPGRLRARLADAAERDGLVEVAYRVVDAPVGPLLVAGTTAGLVRVAFSSEDEGTVLQELAEYFEGRRRTFDLPLDWRLASGFRADVLHHLATDVRYGATASYGALAALAGRPRAVRAVGTACATNPLPVVVPCHRVVHADGRPGRYRGGEQAKRDLLALEAGAQSSPWAATETGCHSRQVASRDS